ncbi:MAG: hypothetical protein WCJ76_08255 [Comamonadaceae bacterium]
MQTQTEPRPSCFARMLDVRSYVLAARRAMSNAEPSTALYMVLVFGLISLLLFPLWMAYDLGSTWDFTTGLRDGAAPAVTEMSYRLDSATGWLGLSLGSALIGLVLTSFTLLPSLFELAFPTVSHPLLNLVLLCSVVFDYITDWGKVSDLVATWTDNPALHFFTTMVLCAFVSVLVQAMLVCSLTVVLFGIIAIVRGGSRQAQAVIIQ